MIFNRKIREQKQTQASAALEAFEMPDFPAEDESKKQKLRAAISSNVNPSFHLQLSPIN